MKFPIEEPTFAPAAQAVAQGHSGSVPVGINHAQGEGGFYAFIAFQDTTYPWRYAFVQQFRCFDPDATPANDVNFQNGADIGVLSEQSAWNCGNGSPFDTCVQIINNELTGPTPGPASIPPGKIFLWATEANRCPNVPNGAIVWLRPGETYIDAATGSPMTDYTFTWSTPVWGQVDAVGYDSVSDQINANPNGRYTWHEVYRDIDATAQAGDWAAGDDGYGSTGYPVGTFQDPLLEANGNPLKVGDIVRVYVGTPLSYNADGTSYSQEFLCEKSSGGTSIWRYVSGSAGPIYAYSDDSTPDPVLVGRKTDDYSGGILQVDGSQSFTHDIVIGSIYLDSSVAIGYGATAGEDGLAIGKRASAGAAGFAIGSSAHADAGGFAAGVGSSASNINSVLGSGGIVIGNGSVSGTYGGTLIGSTGNYVSLTDMPDAYGNFGMQLGGVNFSNYNGELWISCFTDYASIQGCVADLFGRLIVDNTTYPYASDNGLDNLQVVGSQGTGGYGIYCPQFVTAGVGGARTCGATGTDGVNTYYGGLVTVIGSAATGYWTPDGEVLAASYMISVRGVVLPASEYPQITDNNGSVLTFGYPAAGTISVFAASEPGTLSINGLLTINGNPGLTEAAVPLAKLTLTGTQGTLTFTDGILTGYIAPT